MRTILFLTVVLSGFTALFLYLRHRVAVTFPKRKKRLMWALYFLLFLCFMPPLLYRLYPGLELIAGKRSMMLASYLTMGFLSFITVFAFKTHLLELFFALVQKYQRQKQIKEEVSLARRNFLLNGMRFSLFGTGIATAAMATREAFSMPKIETVPVTLKNLPPPFKNFKIVQLSDLHIGPTIDGAWLSQIVEQVNLLMPDMVAITGDLVDGRVESLRSQMTSLANLKSTYGTYFVTGNHETYSGLEDWLNFLPTLNINILSNDHRIISKDGASLCLAGVPDIRTSPVPSSPKKSLENLTDPNVVKILLAHQPSSCHEAGEAGFDLQLSGHTHAGQFYPWTFIVGLVHPYFKGLNLHQNKMQVYVNRGTGYWGPPMRNSGGSEITEIILV
jgi:predicted MPP superfamily phosphohydrolase